MDGQTDRIPISISQVGIAVPTCDKKQRLLRILKLVNYQCHMEELYVIVQL